ncbi:hypothetical protein GCM10010324_35450 [Streptomyces hiroshimensis]|uniref:Uncharacterized protein n=1 Tax=Streptomyces hiroshimensis TaxID=66424 RepID=A0ABQ2YJY8_9ACTN|nr:hypothetical protein GCM10010324_35450 [Streptomyces hiroshimensis]
MAALMDESAADSRARSRVVSATFLFAGWGVADAVPAMVAAATTATAAVSIRLWVVGVVRKFSALCV